ncbi:DUF559 domain-containing protein [Cupriavidus pauculus]|uniref:DUF559 domain-containing protein n=1 Tax=Cupriavidus pauculus TaxID=82633 RepID=UPI00215580E6|nr:DUF559 domain-containing protein [Cupriavidus pauculus]
MTARRPAAPRRPRIGISLGEEIFANQVKSSGLTGQEREYRFDPIRMWRFDFAWPARRLAVEVEGGTWTGGRHTRGSGYQADLEKYNAAAAQGWTVLRFTTDQVKRGAAIAAVKAAIQIREGR